MFGIYGRSEAANTAYLGLYALQHRGQESAGIVASDGQTLRMHKQMGLVADVFGERQLQRLNGHHAIGHVRYSTQGSSTLKNVQPFMVSYAHGQLAIAHNGNLVNADVIRAELEAKGSIFQSTMDTEVIVHLIALSRRKRLADRIIEALEQVEGAYSLLFLAENEMIAVRDPHGFRPLALGSFEGRPVVASETCAFDLIGAAYEREIRPGEMLVFGNDGVQSLQPFDIEEERPCVFEHIYFARPDSFVFGQNVYEVRLRLGAQLAKEQPADADLVMPVPDSGVAAAIGYAEASGIPFQMALIRNHYVGRTFIEPAQAIRHFGVKIKLNPIRELIDGKRVVVIDDSIVRGTTSRKIIKMIRDAGAREVHVRISAPPTTHPCYYGIDTPTREELIASAQTVQEIADYITADSLGYLSIEGLMQATGARPGAKQYCHACFSGEYSVPVEQFLPESQLYLFEPSAKLKRADGPAAEAPKGLRVIRSRREDS
ncbi:MAG: amidophosphoribosyltransferase [Myxococcales bacterium]|nr:amidophosphoribosyltransferase [Myxococcales bacterium]